MPLIAAAVCPHPPMIVPQVAAGAAADLEELRGACIAAIDQLSRAGADRIVVVGAGQATRRYDEAAVGTFAGFGVALEVILTRVAAATRAQLRAPGATITDRLPLSLTVGAWLLAHTGATAAELVLQSVGAHASPDHCATLGAQLAEPQRVALLVMGDGSANHGRTAPGYDDPRARPYDEEVAHALATADVAALLGLDPQRSTELTAAGRAPWQVLAGAARAAGGDWRAQLRYDAAPFGVGYFVATWQRP